MKFRYIAATTAALLILSPAAVAHAAPSTSGATTVVDGLVGPLHLAVGPDKVVTVSEEFASKLTKVRGTTKTQVYSAPDWDVAGVDYRGSTLYFLESQGAGPDDQQPLAGSLKAIDNRGRVTTVTNKLGAYETSRNPDKKVQYGLSPAEAAANPGCVSQFAAAGFPVSYAGELDSHPYSLAIAGNTAYVADAGMNAVLSVNLRTGSIHTVAVLPARPHKLTAAEATGLGLGDCVGLTYGFESVPTDIEVGPDGWLYVASLPGGPEDNSLGARGTVFRVNPYSGRTQVYVTGIPSPTGLALDRSGNLYIASLFGAGVYKVACGSHEARLFLPAVQASDVEVGGSTLYVATGALGNGTLVSVRL